MNSRYDIYMTFSVQVPGSKYENSVRNGNDAHPAYGIRLKPVSLVFRNSVCYRVHATPYPGKVGSELPTHHT